MFSGGVGSWGAACRVAEQHGTQDMALFFADTGIEDEDLHRFLHEAAADVGAPLYIFKDGRTPWEVFRDEGFIANTRVDICSRILKREVLDRALRQHCDPAITTVYLGIDWTESHRFEASNGRGAKARLAAQGWRSEAPLCCAPYEDKPALLLALKRRGIRPPRLYEMGFPHNNCGGFCVKAGQGQFALLLKHLPERYAQHENEEAFTNFFVGKKEVTVLRDRRGGITKPLSLRAFRERVESEGEAAYDKFDLGGCGCFSGPVEDYL